jgi:hypothetical protein
VRYAEVTSVFRHSLFGGVHMSGRKNRIVCAWGQSYGEADLEALEDDGCGHDSRLAAASSADDSTFCDVPKGSRAVKRVPFSAVDVTEIWPS